MTQASQVELLSRVFALPHENKPARLPTIPAVMTATVDLMSDDTRVVDSNEGIRYALCRDACFPLWSDRKIQANGMLAGQTVMPATVGSYLSVPIFDAKYSSGHLVDGVTMSALEFEDTSVVLGRDDNTVLYIPQGSVFQFIVDRGVNMVADPFMEVVTQSYINGDWRQSKFTCDVIATNYVFKCVAGGNNPISGNILTNAPIGFTKVLSMQIIGTQNANPGPVTVFFGWSSDATTLPAAPAVETTMFLPSFSPPEFRNSTIPYRRSRLNAAALQVTNVTPVLQKEGTVLAARLQVGTVDMFSFSAAHINSSHPSQRYFGALEQGLYTFTAPTANIDTLDDCVGFSETAGTRRDVPTFDYLVDSLYNAVILTDLDPAAATTVALSLYAHVEFACTSSLFSIGVTPLTLETLHQAEVKLLRMGYFHGNVARVRQMLGAGRVVKPRAQTQPQQKKAKSGKQLRGKATAQPKAQSRRTRGR